MTRGASFPGGGGLLKRIALVVAVGAVALALIGCGGGGDDKKDEGSTPAGAASRTSAAGTGGTASAGGASTPGAAATADPNATLSPDEQTAQANPVFGGSPDQTPAVISTAPAVTPISGTTPVVDPTEIAPPDPESSDLRFVIDADASKPGIQASREVNPGDTFRVAVVAANVGESTGGLSAVQWTLNYDRTKIFAATISGGDSTARNPDLNVDGLGGAQAGWQCLPAPEGDLDDPQGQNGDGNPATGQAFLSCFSVGSPNTMGDIVVAVVTFTAVAPGQVTLSLSDMVAGNGLAIAWAACEGQQGNDDAPRVPCDTATVTVR